MVIWILRGTAFSPRDFRKTVKSTIEFGMTKAEIMKWVRGRFVENAVVELYKVGGATPEIEGIGSDAKSLVPFEKRLNKISDEDLLCIIAYRGCSRPRGMLTNNTPENRQEYIAIINRVKREQSTRAAEQKRRSRKS